MSMLREGDVFRVYNVDDNMAPEFHQVITEVVSLENGGIITMARQPQFIQLWHTSYQEWSGCSAELLV